MPRIVRRAQREDSEEGAPERIEDDQRTRDKGESLICLVGACCKCMRNLPHAPNTLKRLGGFAVSLALLLA